MARVFAPNTKLTLVGRAISIVQHSFELYKGGKSICADDIVKVLPYLIVQARIDHLLA